MIKIGYPCINRSIGCSSAKTFRLKSFSKEKFLQTVEANLLCLEKILLFNIKHGLYFFRITSDLVPFASHKICTISWQKYFKENFKKIGRIIKENNLRISVHPGQYTVLNSPNIEIVKKAVKDLQYHSDILDMLFLDESAKIQVHVGGIYGDKKMGKKRFIKNWKNLSDKLKKRIVIENDDKSYSLQDCFSIYEEIGIPIIFDNLHHECKNGILEKKAFDRAFSTWKKKDGPPITDYSSQKKGGKKGSHTEHIDTNHFSRYLKEVIQGRSCDIMLEIKDKEKSAVEALKILRKGDFF